jgi:hypothetical protein
MELKILPPHSEGEAVYHVVDPRAPKGGEPVVIFMAASWAEAEQYIHELGGGG